MQSGSFQQYNFLVLLARHATECQNLLSQKRMGGKWQLCFSDFTNKQMAV